MKKRIILIICICSLLLFAGCQKAPTETINGEPWADSWTRVGTVLGIEEPGNGLFLLDSKDALAASDLYYAAWAAGQRTDYINADGDTVDLYDAQLYLLLQDCRDTIAAQQAVSDWQAHVEGTYRVTDTQAIVCAGQEFTAFSYEVISTENPYAFGVTAFGVYENHAINAELACQDSFAGDAFAVLTEFLNGVHYAAP